VSGENSNSSPRDVTVVPLGSVPARLTLSDSAGRDYWYGMKKLVLAFCAAVVSAAGALADGSSDNPTAGLNLGDSDALTGFAAKFEHHLVSLDDGRLKPFDASALKDVKYVAFYYSASWCPPCRAFTPKLVDFYKSFKAQHPNFELIFVNHDMNADDMLTYMTTDAMTWPAVRFDDIASTKANKYCGSGIPDLVLVDADGKVLSDSFQGSNYVGPYKVMDDIKSMVQ
jgi:nucleoredoxin